MLHAMGIRDAVRGWLFPKEERSRIDDPQFWPQLFGTSYRSQSNIEVTPDTAMKLSAVYACIRVIAEAIASIPLQFYKRSKGGKEIADTHDLYYLLHDQPNQNQTSFEFREMLAAHLLLRGNAYSYIEKNDAWVTALYPLNPAKMQVEKRGDFEQPQYRYTFDNGSQTIYPAEYIWHIPGLSFDGLVGISPISYARDVIGLGLSGDQYMSKLYANYARMGVVLTHPGKLSDEATKMVKDAMEDAYTGPNAYKTMILQGGLGIEKIGMTNHDLQHIEQKKMSIEEVARIFKVPTILIGHPDKAATYASVEQQMLAFITHTIRPWTSRIEQSITKSLLMGREKKKYFAEFNLNDFVRGDIATRYNAYALARQWGFMSINDIRGLENLNKIEEGGDDYLHPLNMTIVGKEVEPKNGGNDDSDKKEVQG